MLHSPNLLIPNPTSIRQWESYGAERQQAILRDIATRRLGEPEDIAHGVLFFVAEDASWVTGQVISIDGNVADRYFAVTSEVPKNIVDARISAMPLNGRSARAGAFGMAGLRSRKGISALSSLTAAAGGGVTAISKGNK